MPETLYRPDDLPENVQETDFNNETIKSGDLTAYKGRKDVTDRIGIIEPNKLIVARTHFKQGLGYILCTSEFKLQAGSEILYKAAPCCQHLTGEAESTKRVSCLIVQYDTKPDGTLAKPFGYKVLVWRFSDDKYEQLRNINTEWPLTDHDLMVACSDEKYQRITFNICKQSVLRSETFQKEFGDSLRATVEAMRPKMVRLLGKRLTAQELLEKLGKAQAPAVVSSAMDSPVADIADLLES